MTNHRALLLVIAIYLALAIPHSLIVPLTTGNDEWAHFLYTRFIAENGHLPQTAAQREQAGYKADAPPLYHLLTAAVTAGVEPTRLLRPLDPDQPRRYLADNISDSYALVHTGVERWPFRGEVLLWHLGRGLSIFFGVALIIITYATALLVFNRDDSIPSQPPPAGGRSQNLSPCGAVFAAALVAFTPAVIFHSSVLSYESFSTAMTALFLLLALKALAQPARRRWWLALGLTAGLAVTIKYSAVLLPLEILFVALLAWRGSAGEQERGVANRPFAILTAAAAMLLAVSWWFGFLLLNFNTVAQQGPLVGVIQPLLVGDASDTTSVNLVNYLLGESTPADSRPPLARNYPQLAAQFINSFWAAPVDGRFWAAPWPALLLTILSALGLAGLWSVWRDGGSTTRAVLLLLLFHSLLILPLLLLRVIFSYDPREVAQGRHLLLPAASAIAILLVWGWQRWSRWLVWLSLGGLLLWSVVGQVGRAAQVYPPPIPVWPAASAAPAVAAANVDAVPADGLRLRGAQWQPTGDELAVTLWWAAESTMMQDYLIELTLLDDDSQPVGYAVGQPAQGRYPTRAWESGDVIEDVHRLLLRASEAGQFDLRLRLLNRAGQPLPDSQPLALGQVDVSQPVAVQGVFAKSVSAALRPNASIIVAHPATPHLRLLDGRTVEPLRSTGSFHAFVVQPNWPAAAEVWAGDEPQAELTFDIPPRSFTAPEIPTPLAANFNGEIALLGYDLPTRRIQPGGRLPLTLYWQALAYIGHDYRIFANPLAVDQQRWGGYDRRPRDGYSTLRWVPGEVITDPFGVPIDPAAPPGVYTIDVGLYRQTEAGAESLPLLDNEGQPIEQRSIRLGPIKVGGPPPAVIAQNPQPQVTLNQPFGENIALLGYDLMVSGSPAALNLTLYWQAEGSPAADYTRFFHLRDAAGQNVAQQDSPPAQGRYPTGLWDAGEVIVDKISLSLDQLPPGNYTPIVGLYLPATGERLPTPGGPANEIPLEPVQVTNGE